MYTAHTVDFGNIDRGWNRMANLLTVIYIVLGP